MRLLTTTVFVMLALPAYWVGDASGQDGQDLAALDQKIDATIRELGTLQSAVSVDFSSPTATTIRFIVEAGATVREGDKLVQLEQTAIQDALAVQQAKLAKTNSELSVAKLRLQNAETVRGNASAISEKQLAIAKLQRDLAQGEDGKIASAKQDLADQLQVLTQRRKAISLALRATKEAKKSSQADVERQAAIAELTADLEEVAATQARLQREKKRLKLVGELTLAQLDLEIRQQQAKVDESQNAMKMELQQSRADVKALEIAKDLALAKQKILQQQLDECVIRAPHDGVIIYPALRRGESLRAGSSVRADQLLLSVADPKQLQVAVEVNETRIARVKVGQTVEIRVDAMRKTAFEGEVVGINVAPEAPAFYQESGKRYKVLVSILNPDSKLRIGMTAMADIQP